MCYSIAMKMLKLLSLFILLSSFLVAGCSPTNDSSSSQSQSAISSATSTVEPSTSSTGESSKTSTGETKNENPSDLPWIF